MRVRNLSLPEALFNEAQRKIISMLGVDLQSKSYCPALRFWYKMNFKDDEHKEILRIINEYIKQVNHANMSNRITIYSFGKVLKSTDCYIKTNYPNAKLVNYEFYQNNIKNILNSSKKNQVNQ